jgi:hypothetical protein
VVLRRLDPNDARWLGRAEPERKHRSERDRDLPDGIAHAPSTDDALDPVGMRDGLQATLEHDEQRAVVALVDRVLARHEAEVRRRRRESLALGWAKALEERDLADLVRRDHRV